MFLIQSFEVFLWNSWPLMCRIPASHYLASNSKKMTYGHELSLNLTHQNRVKINKAEWRTHVDHELTFCTLHFCPEHMFLQLISLGICDGAFLCVCFLCVGILGKKLLLWEKKQFLLLSGHGPNKDHNWTLNHKLAAKPVPVSEMSYTDFSGSWGRLCPDCFVLIGSISHLLLNQSLLSFVSVILESPSAAPKCNLMSQQQHSLTSVSEMGRRPTDVWSLWRLGFILQCDRLWSSSLPAEWEQKADKMLPTKNDLLILICISIKCFFSAAFKWRATEVCHSWAPHKVW